jgi:hypothetical protein
VFVCSPCVSGINSSLLPITVLPTCEDPFLIVLVLCKGGSVLDCVVLCESNSDVLRRIVGDLFCYNWQLTTAGHISAIRPFSASFPSKCSSMFVNTLCEDEQCMLAPNIAGFGRPVCLQRQCM